MFFTLLPLHSNTTKNNGVSVNALQLVKVCHCFILRYQYSGMVERTLL
jgi:hypothetical protein